MHLYERVCFWLCKPPKRSKFCTIPSLIIPNELFEELIYQYHGQCFDNKTLLIYKTSANTYNTCPNRVQKGYVPKYFMEQTIFEMSEPMVGWNGKFEQRVLEGSYNIKYSKNTNCMGLSFYIQHRRPGKIWQSCKQPVHAPVSHDKQKQKMHKKQRKQSVSNDTEVKTCAKPKRKLFNH